MNAIRIATRCGTDVSCRTSAAKLREEVVQLAGSGVVTLDFADVRTVSHSFADELLAVLAEQFGDEWFARHLRLVNLRDLSRQAILQAIFDRLEPA